MKILQVTQVTVIKHSESPLQLSIQVSGLTATSGWQNPRLDNSADPNPKDAVLEFSFDADRPTGTVLQVLTPISASVEVTPSNGADAVIVSARTNSITVHASEFITSVPTPPTTLAIGEDKLPITTLAIGEEDPMVSTRALGEEGPPVTTQALGEEGPFPSTRALGEEGPPVSTQALGEEGPFPSTRALGEEGPPVSTQALGEEGPSTRALGEENPPITTLAIGEEDPMTDPRVDDPSGWGGPFGRY
ncbi:MAG: hypothetical protein AAGA46_02880 [Cyanobacteria bacterium P01_F01_bin.13]